MNTENIRWQLKHFEQLSPQELYAAIRLRNEVFVVEQHCIFQDADNKDNSCYHFFGWSDGLLAAYSRLVPPGIIYSEVSIGRVVTAKSFRAAGIGKLLMEKIH